MEYLAAGLWCALALAFIGAVAVVALVRVAVARVIVKHLHRPERQTHTPWDAYAAQARRELE